MSERRRYSYSKVDLIFSKNTILLEPNNESSTTLTIRNSDGSLPSITDTYSTAGNGYTHTKSTSGTTITITFKSKAANQGGQVLLGYCNINGISIPVYQIADYYVSSYEKYTSGTYSNFSASPRMTSVSGGADYGNGRRQHSLFCIVDWSATFKYTRAKTVYSYKSGKTVNGSEYSVNETLNKSTNMGFTISMTITPGTPSTTSYSHTFKDDYYIISIPWSTTARYDGSNFSVG